MRYFLLLICAGLCIHFFSCSTDNGPGDVAGSETTNGVTVTSAKGSIHGTARPGIKVALFNSNYLPHNNSGFHADTTADDSGRFSFTTLDSGYYNLYLHNTLSDTALFFPEMRITPESVSKTVTDTLSLSGTISGSVVDSNNQMLDSVVVFIKGSPFSDTTNMYGNYAFSSVSEGVYRIDYLFIRDNLINQGPDTLSAVLEDLPVSSGQDIKLDPVMVEKK